MNDEIKDTKNILMVDLPHIMTLVDLFELITGSTYPPKTLKRRLDLLSIGELKRVIKLWKKAEDSFMKMEEIIINRSDKENDPWP